MPRGVYKEDEITKVETTTLGMQALLQELYSTLRENEEIRKCMFLSEKPLPDSITKYSSDGFVEQSKADRKEVELRCRAADRELETAEVGTYSSKEEY